jgi:hypothetical protein
MNFILSYIQGRLCSFHQTSYFPWKKTEKTVRSAICLVEPLCCYLLFLCFLFPSFYSVGLYCIRIRFETEDGRTLLGICNLYSGEGFSECFTYGKSSPEEKVRQAIGRTCRPWPFCSFNVTFCFSALTATVSVAREFCISLYSIHGESAFSYAIYYYYYYYYYYY